MTVNDAPELLILAPAHELGDAFAAWPFADPGLDFACASDRAFNGYVETFLQHGVWFPFDNEGRLPETLPASLDGFRAIVMDSARAAAFAEGAAAEALRHFEAEGGYIFRIPDQKAPPSSMAWRCLQIMATANLTPNHPGLIARQQTLDEDVLLRHWLASLAPTAAAMERTDAGWAWGDPAGYHLYWPAEAAAETLDDPAWMEPAWSLLRAGLDRARWPGRLPCGKRFALKLYERTGDRTILERVVAEAHAGGDLRHHWVLDGIRLNMELQAPADCDPGQPPPRVRDNAWVWPEVSGNMADSYGYISKVTGDPAYADQAVKQLLTSHRWQFAPDISLWYHVGRPTGPERRSAPWGRGNGWLLYGLRGLLEDLPAEHAARPALVQALRDGLEGLLRWQRPTGLWGNVLDAPPDQSPDETSCTWMFINVYARAWWKGWLRDPRMPAMCERAWRGLKSKLWRGLPVGHCHGTPYMFSRHGYLSRPQGKFMGTGPLMSLLELRRMRRAYQVQGFSSNAPTG